MADTKKTKRLHIGMAYTYVGDHELIFLWNY